jgi:pimeloyl-ACP methyl ester carboxylesterase
MRARYPDVEGFVERGGVKVGYEVFGAGEPALVFVPIDGIVQSRAWKAQVPYLARTHMVVTIDPRGNGRSDRPQSAAAYADTEFVADTIAVMDAVGIDRAVLVGLCSSSWRALLTQVLRPDRVLGVVAIAPWAPFLTPPLATRVAYDFDQMLDAAKRLVPELRMIVVTGPRIDPDPLKSLALGGLGAGAQAPDGLDVRGYVDGLYQHLAACDLAVVQGGLTTTMELTASQRPFIYLPLRHHFEQNFHVRHRLDRYGAGRCLDYGQAGPEVLAQAIADDIGRPVSYRPVETDGAARAASILTELI